MVKISKDLKKKIFDIIPLNFEDSSGCKLIKESIERELNLAESLDVKSYCRYAITSYRDFRSYINDFEEDSIYLSSSCKKFIDEIIHNVYKYDKSSNIKNRLWKHVPEIMHVSLVVDQYDKKKNFEQLDEEAFLHNILSLYEDFFELTIKILSEYAYIIAKNNNEYKGPSEKLIKYYEKSEKFGKTISMGSLKSFFKGFIKITNEMDNCSVLDTKLRNAIAHANKYYKNGKIIIYKSKELDKKAISEIILEMRNFYYYFICRIMKETGLLKDIIKIEKLYRKILRSG